jgi:hypothetical protein
MVLNPSSSRAAVEPAPRAARGLSWGMSPVNHQSLSAFIWSVAGLSRGDYKQSDCGRVTLPLRCSGGHVRAHPSGRSFR